MNFPRPLCRALLRTLLTPPLVALFVATAFAAEPIVHVSICRFHDAQPAMTDAQADAVLTFATNVMKEAGCPIILKRKGSITVFQGSGYIYDPQSYANVNGQTAYNVRIVQAISYCGGVSATCAGCSDVGVHHMSVNTIGQGSLNSLCWLHEFGHNCGLPDNYEDNTRIMYYTLTNANRRLTSEDVSAYLATASGGQSLMDLFTPVNGSGPQAMDVRDFVNQNFFHGAPYALASRYTTADAKALAGMLSDPREVDHRENIATTLCYIGDRSVVRSLLTYFASGDGVLVSNEFQGKVAVLEHLGDLVNKSDDRLALNFLLSSVSDKGAWSLPARWSGPFPSEPELTGNVLAASAIRSLGASGRPEAKVKLIAIRENAPNPRVRSWAVDAIRIHQFVTQNGIGALRSRRN